jgi:hypothetical protein
MARLTSTAAAAAACLLLTVLFLFSQRREQPRTSTEIYTVPPSTQRQSADSLPERAHVLAPPVEAHAAAKPPIKLPPPPVVPPPDTLVHIAVATDGVHNEGLVPLLHSIAATSANAPDIFVHLLFTGFFFFFSFFPFFLFPFSFLFLFFPLSY